MSGFFKAIGNFFKAVGRAFASAAEAIVKSGIGRAILQIIACANPAAAITCPAAAAGLTLAAGGSLKEALFAAAISFGQMGAYSIVGGVVQSVGIAAGSVASGVVKLGLHAVVGGAFSVAQGGSFMTGAFTGAIAAGTSLMMEGTALGNIQGEGGMIARTAVAAIAGGTASVLSGGKFANGAITGAMAHLFNQEGLLKGAPGTQSGVDEFALPNDGIEQSYVLEHAAVMVGAPVYMGVRALMTVGTEGALGEAAFAQLTFRETFSKGGTFAGQSIDDVTRALQSGAMNVRDVPIQYIMRDGQTLMLNTRSAVALQRAGVPRSQWNSVNMTGNAAAEGRLIEQLTRNGLSSSGTRSIRSSGQ